MSYKEIKFMSRAAAMQMKGDSDAIFISISSPDQSKAILAEGFKDVLYLQFDNIDRLKDGMKMMSEKDATDILDFVRKHENDTSKIYVNCYLGESRSAGVALFLSEKYDLPIKGKIDNYNAHVYHFLDCLDSEY